MNKTLNSNVQVFGGFDIMLYYKDVEIQPYAAVSVTVPIGENVEESENMCILYYDDFTVSEVESFVFNWNEGTVTFETDHFSKYLIAKVEPQEFTYYYYPVEASGSPDFDYAVAGTEVTLAKCMFEAPEGKQFKAWAIGGLDGEQKQPGETFIITGETYIYAIWEDIPTTPENPENPENPEIPENPENPENPGNSGNSGNSGSTENPENPETPEKPSDPSGSDEETGGCFGTVSGISAITCVLGLAVCELLKKKNLKI